MGSIPFAASIHTIFSSAGADAGFAAILGLAILVLLYFAQARETATLREQAHEASERVGELEARIAELARQSAPPQTAAATPAAQPAVTPAPAGVASPGPAVRRIPLPIGPPAGVAAPALAAATRLVPLVTDNGNGDHPSRLDWPAEPIKVERAQPVHAGTVAAPVGAPNGATRDRPRPAPAPPRRRIEPGPGGSGARSSGAPRRPLLPPEPPRRRSPVLRVLAVLLVLAAVAGAAVVLLVVTHHKGSRASSTSASRSSNAPGAPQPAGAGAFRPASVTVAVLNGTATTGLAHRTAQRLASAGYKQGAVATATDQTHTATQVAYLPGRRDDALRVAASLKLSPASVQPIDPGTQAVACPPPAPCTADVVVTVGSDLASVG